MKIAVEANKVPGAAERGPLGVLDYAHEHGFEGVCFRTVREVTPTLDLGVLRELRHRADELGLELQLGLAKVNPYTHAEARAVRLLGDGDYTRGMVRMMEACREGADCGELWVGTGSYQSGIEGYLAIDRFRTDAPWPEQLAATERFLRLLAPAARDLDCHLNLETHEEITSFECVRLAEAAGPDVVGITFDPGNVVVRGEEPLAAARRVAPYVRATHLRDVLLRETDDGVEQILVPVGEGMIDWAAVLELFAASKPDLLVSVEPSGGRGEMEIGLDDPAWLALHPDLTAAEAGALRDEARNYAARVARGEAPAFEALRDRPYDDAEATRFAVESAAYLRPLLAGAAA